MAVVEMTSRKGPWAIAVALGSGLSLCGLWSGEAAGSSGRTAALPYQQYAHVLKRHVDEHGRVDYAALKAGRRPLDQFLNDVGRHSPKVYSGWEAPAKMAFWVNVYNARTLQVVINHYPIKGSWLSRKRYGKQSIRHIPGVWDRLQFRVMGRMVTLDEIEHQTLRKEFSEPRIHMALVCASVGCPFLRREPYVAERLDEQLDAQARQFLGDPSKFRIDRAGRRVYVSAIFKWFGPDFAKTYRAARFTGHSKTHQAVLSFHSRYLLKEDRLYLEQTEFDVKYLPYDWSLNGQ